MPNHDVSYGRYRFDNVAGNYLDSMEDLIAHDLSGPRRLGGPVRVHGPSLGTIEGMNQIVEAHLATDRQWLWLTDADMGFPPDTLDRLLFAAERNDAGTQRAEVRPMIGALVFKSPFGAAGTGRGVMGEARPVILDWGTDEQGRQGFIGRRTYPENTVLRCGATGMACVIIHRSVHEAILERFGPTWHDPMPNPSFEGKLLGTDVSFFVRAGLCDKELYVHTGAVTNHQKTCWIGHESYKAEHPDYFTDSPISASRNRAERRKLAKAGR